MTKSISSPSKKIKIYWRKFPKQFHQIYDKDIYVSARRAIRNAIVCWIWYCIFLFIDVSRKCVAALNPHTGILLYRTTFLVDCMGPSLTPSNQLLNANIFIINNCFIWSRNYSVTVDNIFCHCDYFFFWANIVPCLEQKNWNVHKKDQNWFSIMNKNNNILEWLANTNLVKSRGNLLVKQKIRFLQNEKAPNIAQNSLNSTRLCRICEDPTVVKAPFTLSPYFSQV